MDTSYGACSMCTRYNLLALPGQVIRYASWMQMPNGAIADTLGIVCQVM